LTLQPHILPAHHDSAFYEELHTPGHDSPFKVRGPSYLSDGQKVVAGECEKFMVHSSQSQIAAAGLRDANGS